MGLYRLIAPGFYVLRSFDLGFEAEYLVNSVFACIVRYPVDARGIIGDPEQLKQWYHRGSALDQTARLHLTEQ